MEIEFFQNTRIRPITSNAAAEVWKRFDDAWQQLTIKRQR